LIEEQKQPTCWWTMTSAALLRTYRAVRDTIADIQSAAAAVDEHIGRSQIFGTREEPAHAEVQEQGSTERAQQLETLLRRCSRNDAVRGAKVLGSLQSSTGLSRASVR
jgi:hypothetical protein